MLKKFILMNCVCLLVYNLTAQPGKIDSSFGTNGVLQKDIHNKSSDLLKALKVQQDGKIICAGIYTDTSSTGNFYSHAYMLRFKTNGTADSSFGTNGFKEIFIDAQYTNTIASAMEIQADGKIVIAGYGYAITSDLTKFNVLRYNSNGTPDVTFGKQGVVSTDVERPGGGDKPYCLTLQQDGKILVAGKYSSVDKGLAVVRYNPDGKLDNSYGSKGIVLMPRQSETDYDIKEASIALAAGNKVYISIYCTQVKTFAKNESVIIRLDSMGKADSAFGTNGFIRIMEGQNAGFFIALSVLPDEKILVSHNIYESDKAKTKIFVSKYNVDGSPDASFGNNGVFKAVSGSYIDDFRSFDMLVQPDGKIIIGGNVRAGSYYLTLLRLTENGHIDNSFDGDGIATLPKTYSNTAGQTLKLALSGDNNIIAGSDINDRGNYNLLLSKFFTGIGQLQATAAKTSFQAAVDKLQILPNPATDFITINGFDASAKTFIYITDVNGNIIKQQILSNTNRINISHLRPGGYYVQVRYGHTFKTAKFIKY